MRRRFRVAIGVTLGMAALVLATDDESASAENAANAAAEQRGASASDDSRANSSEAAFATVDAAKWSNLRGP